MQSNRGIFLGGNIPEQIENHEQVLRMFNSSILKPVGQSAFQLKNPETRKKHNNTRSSNILYEP